MKWLRVFQVIIDVILFVAVLGCLFVGFLKGEPFQRGFFCDDESIRYPYKGNTVSGQLLMSVTIVVPFFSFVLFEFIANARNKGLVRSYICQSLGCVAKVTGLFLWGALATLIVTEVMKNIGGRLRPHFIDTCQPDFSQINCTDGYITDFVCKREAYAAIDKRILHFLKDARKSFPSGHASFSVFAAVYTVIYLEQRVRITISELLRPILQILMVLWAAYASMSRVFDNRHHSTDVLAGALVGLVIGIWKAMRMRRVLRITKVINDIIIDDEEGVSKPIARYDDPLPS